jgi:nitroimidazol reductase NimA-like FMN-containing flavoprotein (pyridoxamine 5'-phosphate oxidase superfamily)
MNEDLARAIIDGNSYLTLATADAGGRPWATPVWFAHDRYTDFLWLSRPTTRHSANIAARPEVAIVVFDSTVPINQGRAVYVEAVADGVPAAEVEGALRVFSARSVADGGSDYPTEPDGFRLYRARAVTHYVLDEHDSRVRVDLG